MQRAFVYWKRFLSFTHWNILRSDTTVDNRSLLNYELCELMSTCVYLCALCTEQDSKNCPNGGSKETVAFSTGLLPFSGWRLLWEPLTHKTCCQVWSFSWEGDRKGQRISGVSNWATFHKNVGKWVLAYLVETGHRWRGCLFIPGCPGLSFFGGQWS